MRSCSLFRDRNASPSNFCHKKLLSCCLLRIYFLFRRNINFLILS
ncbi:hypothetical protein HMPREF3197_03552 [Klebsiella pneumoniae]|nr:hypothetical protein HMPREF3197_03552 [Klebsiella pneumoniae]